MKGEEQDQRRYHRDECRGSQQVPRLSTSARDVDEPGDDWLVERAAVHLADQ